MIYRMDDFPQGVKLEKFKQIHEVFIKYDKLLTLSVLCDKLANYPAVINYINQQKNIDIQLHGWEHKQYAHISDEGIVSDLELSLAALWKYFHKRPSVWYLPWNGWVKGEDFINVPRIQTIARRYNLTIETDCVDIKGYLNKGYYAGTVYFHLWTDEWQLVEKLFKKGDKI